ncbi:porin family protein [Xylanibacter muris]|uniref:Porin family protein n=1 Tax=Xylanibacter muris TaxID=2736290 RepID=A0ABX2AN17_9BACT|nr:porin family protein [Xylanibacter muris]NPD92525.1 porin family protein [Xylanibacter muris]
MKKIFTVLAVAMAMLTAVPSQAQVKFGLKGGLNVTDMSFSSDVIDKSNQTGFFVGPTLKVTLPIVGLGLDAAALYDQRDAKLGDEDFSKTVSQRSINIPINLRYSIGLGSIAGVYFAAGPQFGFNVGSKNYDFGEGYGFNLEKSNFSINLGAGLTLIKHVEIGFAYNIACGKTGEAKWTDILGSTVEQTFSKKSRTNAWQVSAAYYF